MIMVLIVSNKVQTTINLDDDIKEHIKTNVLIKSFSAEVNEMYRAKYMQYDSLVEKQEYYRDMSEKYSNLMKDFTHEKDNLITEIEKSIILNKCLPLLKSKGYDVAFKVFVFKSNNFEINKNQFKIICKQMQNKN